MLDDLSALRMSGVQLSIKLRDSMNTVAYKPSDFFDLRQEFMIWRDNVKSSCAKYAEEFTINNTNLFIGDPVPSIISGPLVTMQTEEAEKFRVDHIRNMIVTVNRFVDHITSIMSEIDSQKSSENVVILFSNQGLSRIVRGEELTYPIIGKRRDMLFFLAKSEGKPASSKDIIDYSKHDSPQSVWRDKDDINEICARDLELLFDLVLSRKNVGYWINEKAKFEFLDQ